MVRRRRGRLSAVLALVVLGIIATVGGRSGPASAQVLHPLNVTATTSIDRVCTWTIDKTGPTHLTLAVGEVFTVPYDVTVTKTCTDTNRVTGTISGQGNPTAVAVTIGGTAGTANCTYDAGTDTFQCTYEVDPPTTASGVVNAVATYAGGGTADNAPGTAYSFAGAPVNVSEDSVDVFDSFAGTLAIHLNHSATFHYTRDISFDHCGDHFVVENTARVVDGTELGRVTHTLVVDVPCHGNGCTLTLGYWKTHSKYGPAAKPDATWNLLPGGLGPDTTFFLSGQTWLGVFQTPPAGNVYYQLAHQYMAARLNILNGASSTAAVNAAIAWATTFFQTYTPAQAGAFAKNSSIRAQAISAAGTLGSYNEGAIGPGHCSE